MGRPNRSPEAPERGCSALAAFALPLALALAACSTVNPGGNFSVPEETFNEDYFFCHVEPQLIFAKRCGPGDPAAGDSNSGCHFNPGAVSGMALVDHFPVDCGGGDRPVSRGALGTGSAARGNLQAVSLVMSRDHQTSPLYLRPTGANHPRAVFAKEDPVVDVIRTWAQKP